MPDQPDEPDAIDEPDHILEPISDPIGTARRRHGTAGAILAAGLLGVDQALFRKPKEEAPIVVAASDQPIDIDTDGIRVPVDESTDIVSPPLPRSEPVDPPRRSRKK